MNTIARYKKAIAAFVGGALAVAAAVGILPAEVATEETTTAIVTGAVALGGVIAAVITAISPKNKE